MKSRVLNLDVRQPVKNSSPERGQVGRASAITAGICFWRKRTLENTAGLRNALSLFTHNIYAQAKNYDLCCRENRE